jgi:hypothetical protein
LTNEKQNTFQIPNQRYKPLVADNAMNRSVPSAVQDSLEKFKNISQDNQAQFIPARNNVNDNSLNVINIDTSHSNNSRDNPQFQDAFNNRQNRSNEQNVPAPPLANNDEQPPPPQQQFNTYRTIQALSQNLPPLNPGTEQLTINEKENYQLEERFEFERFV